MTITGKQYNFAYLLLEYGQIFRGKGFGAHTSRVGEVVFHTGMTDYKEALHSLTYAGQIVTMTYPLIGNCGMNEEDVDFSAPKVKGIVVKEHCSFPSHRSQKWSLDEWLQENDIPGLYAIDTRKLTKIIRQSDRIKKGKIVSGLTAPLTKTELEREMKSIKQKEGRSHATLS